jgi:hypothetical protein
MLKTLFFFTLFAPLALVSGQQISNQVVNSTGGFGQAGGNFTVAYAVGESMTTTLSATNAKLTQGFLQPEIQVRTGIFVQTNADCSFAIFPNPTAERISTDDTKDRTFDILTIDGRLIGSFKPRGGSIDVSQLAQGSYVIRTLCGNATEGNYKSLKFIKQ